MSDILFPYPERRLENKEVRKMERKMILADLFKEDEEFGEIARRAIMEEDQRCAV